MIILTVTLFSLILPGCFSIMETIMIAELYRHGTRYTYTNIFNEPNFAPTQKMSITP